LDKFYRNPGREDCNNIKAVASDGARGFLFSTKLARNAPVVLGHFLVKKHRDDALDTVRKEKLRKARKENNDKLSQVAGYLTQGQFKNERWNCL